MQNLRLVDKLWWFYRLYTRSLSEQNSDLEQKKYTQVTCEVLAEGLVVILVPTLHLIYGL